MPLEEGRMDWTKVCHGDFYFHMTNHPTEATHGPEVWKAWLGTLNILK